MAGSRRQGWKRAYTRAGDLRITPEGRLETSTGAAVYGEGGLISLPQAEKIDIANDGTISILPVGEEATTLVAVDRIRLVKPELSNLEKKNDGFMHTIDGSVPQADASVSLVQGALEGSNVNAVSAMVEMIELARNFELQTKVMKNADDNSGVSAKLMQMA